MDNDILTALIVGVPSIIAIATAAVLVGRRRSTDSDHEAATRSRPEGASSSTGTLVEPRPAEAEPEAPGVEVEELPDLSQAPPVETPAPATGRLARLRDRLSRSGSPLGARLLTVLSRDHLTEDDWDELEETLLLADVGAGPSGELIDALRTQVRVQGVREPAHVRAMLREQLLALVDPSLDRSLATAPTPRAAADGAAPAEGEPSTSPAVVLVVGVNGTGKTTTVGKLARVLVAEGRTVVLGAADTFRAAAADQLETWGSRVGVPTVRSERDGADPAAVAFDAVRTGVSRGVDVVLVDTAGRLQNKAGLMDELGKITRVITREAPLSEVLLVLDATTGQNGLNQARVFAEVAGVTGIVLTKLDGTAKGGIVIAVQRELGVPVKLVGLGEGPDDLAPFDPEAFVDGLLGD
ncbi:signal recognition particle-docking protein FtsY [Cellulomonas chengniuliangii]|uniref:signal recognition particle-docking protein FtsY n=1 Tax=Cellulomonas chengniuliangii TaxID=2968084 RepID=UPI001D0EBE6A|nr:signal recognition particle-docking protein FtsY [Cellulomonas chengniuliangii]MCC2319182.1 signal recognition particle-docking protein FtsY [Cellulomonas chengniuliangii]MCC2319323.1 signal recognition particle-docking protein FtsY [Cellulomonas chengniuliangii]